MSKLYILTQVRKTHIKLDIIDENKSFLLSVLRCVDNTMINGISGCLNRNGLSIKANLPRSLFHDAEDSLHGLRTFRTNQSGKTHHLTIFHMKVQIFDSLIRITQILYVQSHIPNFTIALGIVAGQLAANHHIDQFFPYRRFSFHISDADSIPDYQNPIRNLKQFVQSVRNIDNADALCLQSANDSKQSFRLCL